MSDERVGVVDYGAGNIESIISAFEFLGAGVDRVSTPGDLEDLTHLVLPGVGAFGFCADRFRHSGMLPSVGAWTHEARKPLLGICVGMQLMADTGEELGNHQGLGWIGGTVAPLEPQLPDIRVPHVGWNDVRIEQDFGNFRAGDSFDFYFDHSFAYQGVSKDRVIASCAHGRRFAAAVRRDNIVASQFHPEKSQNVGMRFLKAFLAMEA